MGDSRQDAGYMVENRDRILTFRTLQTRSRKPITNEILPRNPGCPQYRQCLKFYALRDSRSWTCQGCPNAGPDQGVSSDEFAGLLELAGVVLMGDKYTIRAYLEDEQPQ